MIMMMMMSEDYLYLTVSMYLLSCAIQMHLVFTARCYAVYAERRYEIECRLSLSVCVWNCK